MNKSKIKHSDGYIRSLYQDELSKYPTLSKKEEIQCAMDMRHGIPGARDRLINHNLKLVLSVVNRHSLDSDSLWLDCVQEGSLGLIKAVDGFDPDRRLRFSTYAMYWIRFYVRNYLVSKRLLIYIPISMEKETGLPEATLSLDDIDEKHHYHHIADIETLDSVMLQRRVIDTLTQIRDWGVITQSEFLVLSRMFGLNNTRPQQAREIAQQNDRSLEWVFWIRRRAICKLKQSLALRSLYLAQKGD